MALVATGALVLSLRYGRDATCQPLPRLPHPGLTGWPLPAARLRAARWSALVWTACTALTFLLTLADLLAVPVREDAVGADDRQLRDRRPPRTSARPVAAVVPPPFTGHVAFRHVS